MEVNASTNKVGGAGNVELKCRVQIVRKQLQVLSLPHLVSDVYSLQEGILNCVVLL